MVWVYLCIYTPISGHFERPTLRGCRLLRTMARLSLRFNAFPAKRPSLRACCCGSELWWFGFICVFTRLYADGFERPTLRGCTWRRIVAGLSLRSNACPAKRPTLWGCFVLNTLHITLICLMRNGGGYGYFIMIQSCNLPLHTSSSAKSTPLSPTPREAA